MVALFAFPFIWTIIMGFTNFNLWAPAGEMTKFIGLANYKRLFKDVAFLNSIKVTLSFVFAAISGHLVFGFLFANLLRLKEIRFKGLVSAALLIAWLTPGLVAAYMWRSVFDGTYGWLNTFIGFFGHDPVDWLKVHPLMCILLVNWTRGTAMAYLLLSSALSDIPVSVYEAAKIDGTNTLQTLLHIKLPMIKYSILVTLLVSTFSTLLAFDMIYGLTGGGPMGKTEVFTIFIYNNAFQDMQLGYAGAVSTIILIISLLLGMFYIRSMRVEI